MASLTISLTEEEARFLWLQVMNIPWSVARDNMDMVVALASRLNAVLLQQPPRRNIKK